MEGVQRGEQLFLGFQRRAYFLLLIEVQTLPICPRTGLAFPITLIREYPLELLGGLSFKLSSTFDPHLSLSSLVSFVFPGGQRL